MSILRHNRICLTLGTWDSGGRLTISGVSLVHVGIEVPRVAARCWLVRAWTTVFMVGNVGKSGRGMVGLNMDGTYTSPLARRFKKA